LYTLAKEAEGPCFVVLDAGDDDDFGNFITNDDVQDTAGDVQLDDEDAFDVAETEPKAKKEPKQVAETAKDKKKRKQQVAGSEQDRPNAGSDGDGMPVRKSKKVMN